MVALGATERSVHQSNPKRSYASSVLGTGGLVSYWRLDDRPDEGTPHFVGDFDTCDLSQWRDFHDAHLGRSPPGFTIQRAGRGSSGCYVRVTVIDGTDSSATGDAAMLWEGNGTDSYGLPHLQVGSDTWFRMHVLFPDGTSRAYPGRFRPAPPGGWDTVQEWHEAPGAGYSTTVGVQRDGNRPFLAFRPTGGPVSRQVFTYWRQTDGSGLTTRLKFNHWYEVLVHLVYGTTQATGRAEWWIDGVLQNAANVPTISSAQDGSVPGVGHQVGLYRGPPQNEADTIYLDGVLDGPTRASVSPFRAVDAHADNDGTYVGGRRIAQRRRSSGQGTAFDGIDDQVTIAHRPSLGFTRSFTAEAWTGPSVLGHRRMTVVARSGSYRLSLTASRRFEFCVRRTGWRCARSSVVAQPQRRYHVAGTYTGAALCIHVNGAHRSCVRRSGAVDRVRAPVRIGVGNLAAGDYWKGTINDVALYGRALTPEQIRRHHVAGGRRDSVQRKR